MMSHGIPGLPVVLANQRAFSSHVTSIVQGRETSNVVLPFMGDTKSFMQLVDMHRPTPCISPLGLESDNKRWYSFKLFIINMQLHVTYFVHTYLTPNI